uniref:Uncharacterized protein LOC105053318 isoform X2 n=1 Tax=Elaeis guineensis var. tenera TaxID=51953 RepID=A0A8N4F2U4_ELAGV|nr:uncharacterized protein LOC105053318 isoform X2 [Elaeis guineensis]
MMLQRQNSAPHQMMKVELEERRDERVSASSCSSMEQVRSVRRPSRDDRRYIHELMGKVNELEELLTAHKMASSSWTNRAGERRPAKIYPDQLLAMDFNGNSAFNIRGDYGCSYNTKKSEGLRGRLYEKYIEKRDAKLREEWGLRRAYKEAKMKSMWDRFEQSQAEMKARFGGSADGEDLALRGHRHAEKLKDFGARSAIKDTELKVEFIQTEEENPCLQVLYVRYKFFDDTLLSHGSSSSNESKRLLSSRSASSSMSQSSVAPIPRPPVKSGFIRRRTQSENTLAKSVSNNSNHRKENMKSFTGTSKTTGLRTHARSMSTSEGMSIFKEEKPPRSRSMRNCSVGSGELKDPSSTNTDSASSLTPSRFSKERSEKTSKRFQKLGESGPFLRRGNGIRPGAGAFVIQKNGEESEGLVDQSECSPDTAKDKDEQLERTHSKGRATAFLSDLDSERQRSSQESRSSGLVRPHNGDVFTPASHGDEFDASAGGVEELSQENAGSWNSHIKYPSSNSHEALDVNASVDTPTSCPDSWNSHPMNKMRKSDSTRVRKKWAKAEKLVLATTASHQPRNSVAEGFKRLFKFGKNSKDAEGVAHGLRSGSIASDVDNDIANGHDLANQSLDDLRKLRMEYSVSAYHSLNEGKVFPDQVLSLRRSISSHPANSRLGADYMSGNSLKGNCLMMDYMQFDSVSCLGMSETTSK